MMIGKTVLVGFGFVDFIPEAIYLIIGTRCTHSFLKVPRSTYFLRSSRGSFAFGAPNLPVLLEPTQTSFELETKEREREGLAGSNDGWWLASIPSIIKRSRKTPTTSNYIRILLSNMASQGSNAGGVVVDVESSVYPDYEQDKST